MKRSALALLAALVAASSAVQAEEPSSELMTAALQALRDQRDQALNREVQVTAQLLVARRDLARLQEAARATPKTADPIPEGK
ncbi:hypothetical protein [Methylobacterium sp. SyP6R]|uniref:hypothetical protein n=1 Tax=Methylobacterium sp. SyP6R TaxID=2718876 RepID=UPI001F40C53E|nr:hypothetical protein [Methylobacterium sp. SyP6R]MCF4123846.1 hypothetical protein [Methylobacterium sp. SyP6R]